MKRFNLARIPAYAIAAGLAIGFGQIMTASPVTADIYRTVRVSLDKMLSDIAAVPEKGRGT
ncbi:hypothetical protein LZK73_33780 (plasmid) [Neorhizobium galegae]|nr:hypothetical protein LZK73_33780 [Neorhizobium galegae]